MELKYLLDFVNDQDRRIREKYINEDERFRTLSRLGKVTEEVGEMASEVLKHLGQQRQDKLDAYESDHLAEEFADVIFSTLLLAKITNIDVELALYRKMEKVKNRNY